MDFTNTSPYGPESRTFAAESVTGLSAAPTVTPDSSRTPLTCPPRPYDSVKRFLDLFAASLLMVPALPVIVLGWALVRCTSAGPGIYTQIRVGLGGRQFRIYKLRSMTHNCEATTGGAKWSTAGDSRVTPVGRVFRKLHIDELPQLFNVLLGDMSLVGPRPERPEFVKPLSVSIPEYPLRLAVRPGVTGLAQIQLPPDTDLKSVRRKVTVDRSYIENRGLWLDVRLVLGTALYLIGFSYALVRRILALPNPLALSGGSIVATNHSSYTVPLESTSALDKLHPSLAGSTMQS